MVWPLEGVKVELRDFEHFQDTLSFNPYSLSWDSKLKLLMALLI